MTVTCDSDVLSHYGWGVGRGAREIYEALRSGSLYLNVICLFEVRGGMEEEALVEEFDHRFSHLPVLEFTREVSSKAGDLWRQLRRRKKSVGFRDIFLAAVAQVHRVKLITADHDFLPLQQIGLDIQIVTEDSRLPRG